MCGEGKEETAGPQTPPAPVWSKSRPLTERSPSCGDIHHRSRRHRFTRQLKSNCPHTGAGVPENNGPPGLSLPDDPCRRPHQASAPIHDRPPVPWQVGLRERIRTPTGQLSGPQSPRRSPELESVGLKRPGTKTSRPALRGSRTLRVSDLVRRTLPPCKKPQSRGGTPPRWLDSTPFVTPPTSWFK